MDAIATVWHRPRVVTEAHPDRSVNRLACPHTSWVSGRHGPAGDASMGRCASTPSSPASRMRPTTPADSRLSAWTAHSPSRAPTTCSPRWSWPPAVTTTLELATNVAIAFPRNPVQLAHQAWDLQLLAKGRFTLGSRQPDPGPGGEALRGGVRPPDRPDAGDGRGAPGHLRHLGDRRAARLPGRVHLAHPDATDVQPRPTSVRTAARSPWAAWAPRWCPWPPKWPTACWSCPSTPPPHLRQRHPSRPWPRAWPGAGGHAVGPDGHRRGHRVLRTGRGRARDGTRRPGRWLLSFYASTPAYRPVLEVEGWEDLQPELNALSKSGRWDEMPARIDDAMLATLAAVGSPAEVAAVVSRPVRRSGRPGRLLHPLPGRRRHPVASSWTNSPASPTPTPYPRRRRHADRDPDTVSRRDPNRPAGAAMTDPTPHVRRVLPVPRERRGGRASPSTARPWCDASSLECRPRPTGQRAGVGRCTARTRPPPRRRPERPHLGHGGPGPRPTAGGRRSPRPRSLGLAAGLGVARPGDSMADDVALVVERLAPDARAVVGMSLGGATAIALATRHPHLVPPAGPGRHHPGGERRQDVRHRRLPVRARDVRHVRRDPGAHHPVQPDPVGVVVAPRRPPQLGPAARRNVGLAPPGRAARRPTPGSTSSGPTSSTLWDALERHPGAGAAGPGQPLARWWTTTTSPSSAADGPTTR